MAADPLDINNLPPVIECHDEAEVIALNVKHRPIRADDTDGSKGTLQIGGIPPCGAISLVEPSIQSALHRPLQFVAGKRLDKARQCAPSDHAQKASITRSQTGNKLAFRVPWRAAAAGIGAFAVRRRQRRSRLVQQSGLCRSAGDVADGDGLLFHGNGFRPGAVRCGESRNHPRHAVRQQRRGYHLRTRPIQFRSFDSEDDYHSGVTHDAIPSRIL